jgi:protein TonB
MKNILMIAVLSLHVIACGPGGSEPPQASPKAPKATTSEPPPLETVTMDDPEIVPIQEQQTTASKKPVGVPCPWAKIWETPGPKPMPVGGMVKAPQKVSDVAPVLPYRKTEAKGAPVLEVVISTEGNVSEVKVLQSFDPSWPEGEAALADAVRQWKYKPTLLEGKPIPVCTKITLSVEWTEFSREK